MRGVLNIEFKELIKEICTEEEIHFKTISKDWIIVLEKNGIEKLISGYKFDLNGHALGILLDDKYATYELLKDQKFPVIDHNIVYSAINNNDYAIGSKGSKYVKDLFYKYNEDVVLKINDGSCGLNVIHIRNIEELMVQYDRLSQKYFSVSICPYYDIKNEFRAIVLNDNVEIIYKKVKPIVVGNGKNTIKELLLDFNYEYFKNIQNKDLDRVIEKDEIYEYDWRFNLSRGAKVDLKIEEQDSKIIKELATMISKRNGLRFCSIDIIKTSDNNFFIMEINSGVMMENFIKQVPNGYKIAKQLYQKAIKSFCWDEY